MVGICKNIESKTEEVADSVTIFIKSVTSSFASNLKIGKDSHECGQKEKIQEKTKDVKEKAPEGRGRAAGRVKRGKGSGIS